MISKLLVKEKILFKGGFKSSWCNIRKEIVYTYNEHIWTRSEVNETSSRLIHEYTKYYNNQLDFCEVDRIQQQERRYINLQKEQKIQLENIIRRRKLNHSV